MSLECGTVFPLSIEYWISAESMIQSNGFPGKNVGRLGKGEKNEIIQEDPVQYFY